jgi:hypothetical protein
MDMRVNRTPLVQRVLIEIVGSVRVGYSEEYCDPEFRHRRSVSSEASCGNLANAFLR